MKIVFKKWEIKSCCCSKNTASAKSIYTHKKRMTEKIYNAYNYIIRIHTHTYIYTYIYTHTHTYIYTYIYLSDFLIRYFGLIRRVTKSVTICPPPSSSSKSFRTWNRTQIVKNHQLFRITKVQFQILCIHFDHKCGTELVSSNTLRNTKPISL